MPQRRSRRPAPPSIHSRCRPLVERLEDRTTPTVTATQDPGTGILTVSLDAVNDAATITGTDASGTTIAVAGITPDFTGVTGIAVVDSGSNLGQSVTFNDAGPDTGIDLSGAISVTGIETVAFATADAPLQAASVAVSGASTEIQFLTDVTTTGAGGQAYAGPVILSSPTVTLNAGAAGGIGFTQSVNSDPGTGPNALVLDSGGTTTFTSILGGVNPLASLTTDAAGTTQLGANVVTVGDQIYNDPAILSGTTITLTSNSGGAITFANTLNASSSGASSLVENTTGKATFAGVVGTTALSSLTTNAGTSAAGGTLIQANITTTGVQMYNNPVVVSGASITLLSTVGENITFNSTLDDDVAGSTALAVATTTGTTTFFGNVGSTAALGSLTTDAGTGSTIIGPGPLTPTAVSVITTGAQTYHDPVSVAAASVTLSSTSNGNITFGATLDDSSGIDTVLDVDTGGTTTFTGLVGGTTALDQLVTDNAGQPDESTVIQSSITTTDAQTYGDAVTFTPASGITSQTLASTIGAITFQSTLGGAAAVPVTIHAGANAAFNGNADFSAAESRFNVQAGAAGTGAITFSTGLTFSADVQTWQAGDGTGGDNSAAAKLTANSPTFQDAAGTGAPITFVLRQDAAITDADIPATAQFGGVLPVNYTILSDDGSLTLDTTTDLADSTTENLTLASDQTLSLGATIDAPNGVVRLRSEAADVTQTGGGITAAGLGAMAGTSLTLTGTNAIAGTVAEQATSGNLQFTNGAAYTIGAIGADPLGTVFTTTTGVEAAAGTVTLSQPGSSPLDVSVFAPLSGSTVTANGGTGNDSITVNYTIGGSLVSGLVYNGGGGSDSLILTDAGSTTAHTYTIGSSFTRDSDPAITYSGVESVSVTGGTSGDTFDITPDATAAITAIGGDPTGSTGDTMTLTLTGATAPVLTATKAADGFQGTASFSNLATVTFSQMESIAPQADISVASSASAALIPIGGTTTLTIVVSNAGPSTAAGTTITDTFPAGITTSWTAVASAGSTVAAASGTGNINTSADIAALGTVTFTITATANPGFLGTITNTLSASAGTSAFDLNAADNQATSSFTVEAESLLAVGAGAGGGPEVKVYNADGSVRYNFFAYNPAYLGGVTVATGDLNGDGVDDIVTGSAQGSSNVEVFDGATGNLLASFFAFPGFNGGVNVAVADNQIIVGAGVGGGPIFTGFSLAGGLKQNFSMFAFDPSFRGGVEVAGSSDLITVGAGPGGGPNVKVFNASTLNLVTSFYAFLPGVSTGVNVGMGFSDGRETVIAGAGTGSSPAVATFDANIGKQISSVQAFDAGFAGGVFTTSTTTPQGQEGTVVGAGPGGAPRVRVLDPNGDSVLDFFAFDPSFRGGVYVG